MHTVTITLPSGGTFKHQDSYGATVSKVPFRLWQEVADAAGLQGLPGAISVYHPWDAFEYLSGQPEGFFIQVGKVRVRRGIRLSQNHTDYTVENDVLVDVRIENDYR